MTVRPRLRVPSVALSLVLLACAALKAAAIHIMAKQGGVGVNDYKTYEAVPE